MHAPFASENSWSEQLVCSDAGYQRRVLTIRRDGSTEEACVPLFFSTGAKRMGRMPDVNWSPATNHAQLDAVRHSAVPNHWVNFDTADLKRTRLAHPVIPQATLNPSYEFTVAGKRYVVDGITVLQRMVATRDPLFTLLMNPFREICVVARLRAGVVNIVFDTAKMHRAGFLQRDDVLGDVDASCLAFWCSDEERLAQLDRCASSIQFGNELVLPQTACRLRSLVRGLSDGNTIFVQSLGNGVAAAGQHDLLWRDAWSSIRVTRPSAAQGLEISDRLPKFWRKRLIAETREFECARRNLSAAETDLVRLMAGWSRTSVYA